MSDDCCEVPSGTLAKATGLLVGPCPDCGSPGKSVREETLKSLLTTAAMRRRNAGAALFCPNPACVVVYFGTAGRFERGDIAVPVFQKDANGNTPVCYCFGHTRDSILQELKKDGSGPSASISQKVKDGLCACELRNPQGSCCLGNVARVIKEEKASLES